jgi:hypothetical protein
VGDRRQPQAHHHHQGNYGSYHTIHLRLIGTMAFSG